MQHIVEASLIVVCPVRLPLLDDRLGRGEVRIGVGIMALS